MSISTKDVEHVAKLARLDLSEEEKQLFTEQLNAILKYAEQLNGLDTTGVAATTHVLPLANVMRADEPHQSLSADKVMLNAPDHEDGHFRVPAVIE
jgi:aspartyl-tRNA(Asn)/glutamyl-tRNA(Gln) amidotransferase subunit C